MRPSTAAPKKKGGVSRGIGVVVVLVAAVVIIVVAYFATRPGGLKGKEDTAGRMARIAKSKGFANEAEMWKSGGPWGGKRTTGARKGSSAEQPAEGN